MELFKLVQNIYAHHCRFFFPFLLPTVEFWSTYVCVPIGALDKYNIFLFLIL